MILSLFSCVMGSRMSKGTYALSLWFWPTLSSSCHPTKSVGTLIQKCGGCLHPMLTTWDPWLGLSQYGDPRAGPKGSIPFPNPRLSLVSFHVLVSLRNTHGYSLCVLTELSSQSAKKILSHWPFDKWILADVVRLGDRATRHRIPATSPSHWRFGQSPWGPCSFSIS